MNKEAWKELAIIFTALFFISVIMLGYRIVDLRLDMEDMMPKVDCKVNSSQYDQYLSDCQVVTDNGNLFTVCRQKVDS